MILEVLARFINHHITPRGMVSPCGDMENLFENLVITRSLRAIAAVFAVAVIAFRGLGILGSGEVVS